MAATPDLKLVVDDRATTVNIVLAWMADLDMVAAFVIIGGT